MYGGVLRVETSGSPPLQPEYTGGPHAPSASFSQKIISEPQSPKIGSSATVHSAHGASSASSSSSSSSSSLV